MMRVRKPAAVLFLLLVLPAALLHTKNAYYYLCSNFIMAQVGLLLARGTATAMTAVLFALPQLLLWVEGKGRDTLRHSSILIKKVWNSPCMFL